MQIGITYDLRDEYLAAGYSDEETAEFDRADTIDAIDNALQSLGHQTDRVGHARQLVQRLAQGDRWDLVFNICEGLSGPAREAQVPTLLELYNIACTFGDASVMTTCLNKGLTKTIVRDAGLPTPHFCVFDPSGDQEDSLATSLAKMSFPMFVKPLSEGTGKGVTPASRVGSEQELRRVSRSLATTYRQNVLVEEFLPGREFTVGLLGTGRSAIVLGTLEIVLREAAEPDVYSYVNKERCEELVEYRRVRAEDDAEVRSAEQIALAAWRLLGCRDAGRIDLRSDAAGQPQFLEANPLAGLHPSHSDLPMLCTAIGMEYIDLIDSIVQSAMRNRDGHAASAPNVGELGCVS